jgi:hypothetical protein
VAENLLDGPGIGPEDVPVIVTGAFGPASLFPVLNEDGFVKIGLPL